MHDPEKACPALDAGWVPVFPRDKREAFARRSCSNKKIERDDDSKKSHPALALLPGGCAIPNGPDRMAVKTSAASMRRRRLLPRCPLPYRVVFEAWKILTRGTNAGRCGLNEGGRQKGDGL